ncbi:hypothetical protein GHK92_20210 [Nocardioides sp. dk4132]|uniref:hypothetical protein n=1 Tax=unclassified Nocardioides TaxID=2615069 RepID=UPI00129789AE|nr:MULTISPECIES: hypothetical protein [unclassified Nocardioides]MQW78193.1 hypothetical protein [Nocardioides sp. dk4132]QGA06057.1 hypothetical protein GFH29_00580 [Nocardioides sp. dk884]
MSTKNNGARRESELGITAPDLPINDLDPVRMRVEWLTSHEGKRWPRVAALVGGVIAVVGALSGVLIWWLLESGGLYPDYDATDAVKASLAGLAIASCAVIYAVNFVRLSYRRRFEDSKMLLESRGALDEAEAQFVDDTTETGFQSLWSVTQRRLDYYHQIATSQSRQSFIYGQVAAGLGLAIVLLCAVLAAAADSTAASVSSALLGAAGAGLAGYIGATFMRSQDIAAQQLRAYFSQPLEFSRFLAAERLLSSIDDASAREAATVQLVAAIAAGTSSPTD